MKALILAAGQGTRLRPLTNTIPKPLLPIKGQPLLFYHLCSLAHFGISDVLIKTHYLHEQIEEFVRTNQGKFGTMSISVYVEKELNGSAAFLTKCKNFFDGDEDFLVIYGDNYTDIDYKKLILTHTDNKALATVACYIEKHLETKGMIVTDSDNRILKFVEKPKEDQIISNYANAGIYVLNKRIFAKLEEIENLPVTFDFGHDFFPYLLEKNEKLYAYKMNETLLDIGSLESYNKAQDLELKSHTFYPLTFK